MMKPLPRLLFTLLTVCIATPLDAQQSWNGNIDAHWGTADNWSPSGVPSGADLSFDDATSQTIDLENVTRSIGHATFDSTGLYTFHPGGTSGLLSFAEGKGITQNGSGAIVFNQEITFEGTQTRAVNGNGTGSITFNGTLNRRHGTLQFSGSHEIIFGGDSHNALSNTAISLGNNVPGATTTTLTLAKTTTAAQSVALGTGTITLQSGRLRIIGSDATIQARIQVANGVNIIETDREVTLNGDLLSNASRSLQWHNTQKIIQAGNVTSSGTSIGTTRTFSMGGFGDVDFTGVMMDSTGDRPLAIVKNGTGTFRFLGDNTYSGKTDVTAGTLLVNGSTSAQGNFNVFSSGALGGTGSIGLNSSAIVWLNSTDAILTPGDDGIGTLTISGGGDNTTAGLVLNAGTLVFDIAGLSSDKIVLLDFATGAGGGASNAGAGGIQITLNGVAGPLGTVYELIGFAATPGIDIDTFTLSTESLLAGWQGTFGYTGNTLTFTAVPEAGTTALLACAAGLLAACRAFRKPSQRV